MAEELTPDICVVGGGPGGIAAATAAVAEGASVVLIEKGQTGGANLTSGTVPSKALIAAAEVHEALRAGPAMGVTGAPLQVNLGKVRDHIVAVTTAISANVSPERLTALGIRVIGAPARFADRRTVVAGEVTIRARRFVLAVGSMPILPELPGLDTVETMTVASAFELSRKPAHLLVLGAGRYALELAQAYTRLGIDSTVIDEGQALPGDDPELAAIVVDRLGAEGIRIRTGIRIVSIARRRGGIRFAVADPSEGDVSVDGSHLVIATGRAPDVEGLNLPAGGIAHDRAGIVVNGNLRTTNHKVFAIGDAIAGDALASRAEYQAVGVVRSISRRIPFRDDPSAVPVVAFTDPALARIGLSEAEARTHHRNVQVVRFPFVETVRAQAERQPAGMIKVIATKGGRILGAAIVGRGAGELIAPWSLAIANRLSLAGMAAVAAPYPTRSEIARRVAAGFEEETGLTAEWRKRIIGLFKKLG